MADRSQQIELKLLIEAIYLRYGYDFRGYSAASLKRRVLLALRQLQCEGISELQHKILYDPQVFMELLQYLTIPVSEMFRDPSYYLALREQVVPVLRTYPSPVAARAKRSTRWPFCCARKACWSVRSSTPPISIRARWSRPGRASSASTICSSTPRTTSEPAASAASRTITPLLTTRRSWTSR